MICDAGGATTDLTSYTIRRLSPLEVVELVPPLSRTNHISTGRVRTNRSLASAGGSLDLDKKFEDYIGRNLHEEAEFIPMKRNPLFAETINQFDREVKQTFTSSSTRPYSIQLKGSRLTDEPSCKLTSNTMVFGTYDFLPSTLFHQSEHC